MRPDRFRAYCPEGHVIVVDDVPVEGNIGFTSEHLIERVVFYCGAPEEERVVGAVDVRRDGNIEIDPELPGVG